MIHARQCTQCTGLKFYDKTGGQNKKASGFMGAVCWDCHKVNNTKRNVAFRATPDGQASYLATGARRRSTEEGRAKACIAGLAWQKKYPEKATAKRMQYVAAKLQRVPVWADLEIIAQVYAEAQKQGLEVDHIYPLRGKLVSGLHVENNLQLLPKLENIRKGNKMPALKP